MLICYRVLEHSSLPKPVISDEPVVLHFDDALQLLRDAGLAPEGGDDLSGADELRLGELVKEKHGVDFFVVDRYPSSIRPFYTMLDPSDRHKVELLRLLPAGPGDLLRGATRARPLFIERSAPCACGVLVTFRRHRREGESSRADSRVAAQARRVWTPTRRPLGLSEEHMQAFEHARAAARGLRVWLGARRLPLPRARQH